MSLMTVSMGDKQLLYIIGQPGAGKTALLNSVMKGIPQQELESEGVRYIKYPGGVQLGGSRDSFGGTDVLPLNAQPKVLQWMQKTKHRAIVAEGDRLANDKFFTSAVQDGWLLTVCHLDCPDSIAQGRRDRRGSQQNPSWIRGRQTKVSRLADRWGAVRWRLDATQPLSSLVERLQQHPVIEQCKNPMSE